MTIRSLCTAFVLAFVFAGVVTPAQAGATLSVIKDWGSGAKLELVLMNDTGEAIEDWSVGFELEQRVEQVWNGQLTSQHGAQTLISGASYNSTIPIGGTVAVGMIVAPGNIAKVPDEFLVNSDSRAREIDTEQPTTESPLSVPTASTTPTTPSPSNRTRERSVSENGKLGVLGSLLVNQSGAPIQLNGMSSHGLQWFGEFMNESSIEWIRDDWQADVVRAAMYTDPGANGYVANPSLINKVYEVVDAAIALDMYVIIDWHILADNDPNLYKDEAIEFFDTVSKRYSGVDNVIYEIANEPNSAGQGGQVTWQNHIKPYAQAVVPIIRANDPDSIIVVGTSTWSQDLRDAADDPLTFGNIAYAMHFYACTHGQLLRDKVSYAVNKGVAVFATEWGAASANGDGDVCVAETRAWIEFLNGLDISWVNWSLADKDEGTAALTPGASPTGGWDDNDLSESGRLVRELMRDSAAQ